MSDPIVMISSYPPRLCGIGTARASHPGGDERSCSPHNSGARIAVAMKASGDPDRKRVVRHLRQLIDALNRRVPHIERVGEAKIARDAADLMGKALERVKELEESE